MKKFTDLLSRRSSSSNAAHTNGDSLEADVARGVRLFCESGGPNNSGEEVLHLPVIVDAAESSPAAAREAALVIRKFLSKDNFTRAYVQYNAIMLVRILADNPGPSFTRNLDAKFIATVKELLREGRDMSVQQILRETLDTFQIQKSQDETLVPLITMWQNEKAKWAKRSGNNIGSGVTNGTQPRTLNAPPFSPGQTPYLPQHQQHHRLSNRQALPPPHELASRTEEARTSSKLLMQVVQSTPPAEVLGNELIKEFAERCQAASRSIQGYINADSPAPDEDTLLTLIETNDALATALSKHQRAILNARKFGARSTSPQPPRRGGGYSVPSQQQGGGQTSPPPTQTQYGNSLTLPSQQQHSYTSSQPSSFSGQPFSVGATTSQHASHPQPSPPAVAPAGPPPTLGMPRRVERERIENPFDDSNSTQAVGVNSGVHGEVGAGGAAAATAGASRGEYGSERGMGAGMDRDRGRGESDDENDAPRPARQYRF